MADPQRLLSNLSDADDLERELLGSIAQLDPPNGARGEAWARLSAQIAAVALVSSAHGSAAAAAASTAAPGAAGVGVAGTGAATGLAPLALKLLGSKLAIGLLVAGGAVSVSALWVHLHHHEPRVAVAPLVAASSPAPVAGVEPTPAAVDPALVREPSLAPNPPVISLGSVRSDSPVRASTEQSRQDRLSAESALLTQARAELRNGDAAAAQRSLNRLRTSFPKGVLGQEREVLAIEVLAAQGNAEAARRRAKAFILAFPKSPHSAQLSRFADAP